MQQRGGEIFSKTWPKRSVWSTDAVVTGDMVTGGTHKGEWKVWRGGFVDVTQRITTVIFLIQLLILVQPLRQWLPWLQQTAPFYRVSTPSPPFF